jgi:methionine-rich copper-binding protein CopC
VQKAVSRSIGGASLALASLLVGLHGAVARQMHMVESYPVADAVVDGRNAQYSVRFDGPVDHRSARLQITRDGQTVETLNALLDSAPEVLYASAPRLPPGAYELHWSVKSTPDGEVTEGSLHFTVQR